MLSFTACGRDTIQVRWKTFAFLYDEFTQDNTYQILSQSIRFCRLDIKKHFGVFFPVHSVYIVCYLLKFELEI